MFRLNNFGFLLNMLEGTSNAPNYMHTIQESTNMFHYKDDNNQDTQKNIPPYVSDVLHYMFNKQMKIKFNNFKIRSAIIQKFILNGYNFIFVLPHFIALLFCIDVASIAFPFNPF